MTWKGRSFKHADETLSYPFIQWVNDGAALDPRSERGGFACPVDQNVPIPGRAARIHHRGGSSTDVIFTPELSAAILRTRFAWVKDGARLADYTPGARGKLQALGYVIGAQGEAKPVPELVMLTFTGLASRSFGQAYRRFTAGVRKATKGEAPAYAFYAHLRAGQVEMVGSTQQSPITTVELARDVDPDADYTGNKLVDGIPWPDVLAWAEAWKSPGVNGNGVIHGADGETEASPTPPAPGYPEGTVEWASEFPLPFDGANVERGTPLGDLSDNALRYIVEHKAREWPQAVEAAGILLRERQEAQAEVQPQPETEGA